MADCVLEKRSDGVALITLNRPESLNALGGELPRLLAEYIGECEGDASVRCLAITGAGRAFCAGGDVKNMKRRTEGRRDTSGMPPNDFAHFGEQLQFLRRSQRAITWRLHTMAKPVVALVNGVAVGAGLGIALACDLRLASDRARFGTAFRNVGLSGDYGSSYFLPRLVGAGVAREMYFTAELINAERALGLGLVNRVIPQERFLEEGLAFCAELAAGPTRALGTMKEILNFSATHDLGAALDYEALTQRISGLTSDHAEAVKAFLAGRRPEFQGR